MWVRGASERGCCRGFEPLALVIERPHPLQERRRARLWNLRIQRICKVSATTLHKPTGHRKHAPADCEGSLPRKLLGWLSACTDKSAPPVHASGCCLPITAPSPVGPISCSGSTCEASTHSRRVAAPRVSPTVSALPGKAVCLVWEGGSTLPGRKRGWEAAVQRVSIYSRVFLECADLPCVLSSGRSVAHTERNSSCRWRQPAPCRPPPPPTLTFSASSPFMAVSCMGGWQ